MYAIVKTGGKQYRVERGQRLLVERLPAAEGAEIALEPILYRSEEAVFDRDGLAAVTVTARVIGHERGEKLRVFKFKPKRGYKRRTGHRQELTRIEVTDIAAGAARKRARSASAEAPAGDAGAASAAAKPDAGAEPKPRAASGAGAKAAGAKPAAAKAGGAKAGDAKAAPGRKAAAPKAGTAKAAGPKPAAKRGAAGAKPARAKATDAKPAEGNEEERDGS
jgi:large subunit ribosomal protein L21